MRKTMSILAIAATFASLTSAAQADEMPIQGICNNDNGETVSFTGSNMPINDPQTGFFGVTKIEMSMEDYDKMIKPVVKIEPTAQPTNDDMQTAYINGHIVSLKTDPANNRASIRSLKGVFDVMFKHDSKQFFGWECKVGPNLPKP